ncbi:hypothetical protein [Runella sp.]|uniref:hypothetical protein n=1 Tax=Runella sp. TaxID=1960881 RepID=UPI003D1423C5
MSEVVDLWPDFTPEKVRSPKTILKEQADLLAQKTNNVLKADLTTYNPLKNLPLLIDKAQKSLDGPLAGQNGYIIGLTFDIIAPYLNNYKYHLFKVEYEALVFYPIRINETECINEPSFIQALQSILNRETTIKVINSLYSQSLEETENV